MFQPIMPDLPIAFGNEEETMMQIGRVGALYKSYTEPVSFVKSFNEYLPENLKFVPNFGKYFLENGAAIYNGGSLGTQPVNLERVTPECSTPVELSTYIQANEDLLVKMLSNYVAKSSRASKPLTARVQRRVVDSNQNSRGCHDSVEARNLSFIHALNYNKSHQILLTAHLATRSFMTGAGYAGPHGLRFAQKVEHLEKFNSYGYVNSVFRTIKDADTGTRVEIRCNDINVSPWAIQQRIGTAALFLTMMQTPLLGEMREAVPMNYEDKVQWQKRFRVANTALMTFEGELQPTKNVMAAIDFQDQMYHLMGSALGKYIDIPDTYKDIINEGSQYCHDFKSVLNGRRELSYLSNRSDLAAKFSRISKSMKTGIDDGFHRSSNDLLSRYWDLKYDLIEIAPGADHKPKVEYGYGYVQRNKKKFEGSIDQNIIETALYRPPSTTRAFVRGNLIRESLVNTCDWRKIEIRSQDASLDELDGLQIELKDVILSKKLHRNQVAAYARQNVM